MSPDREAKVQQILDLFKSGDYRVDPAAVAGSVVRRMSLPRAAEGYAPPSGAGQHRIRGIVSVERGRARLAAF